MGRRSTGTVEAREGCIRLKFTHLGQRQVERLELKPTPANLKAATKLLARITDAIRAGAYRREDFFEGVGRRSNRQTFGEYADAWLATKAVARSTRTLYENAIKHTWKPAFGDVALVQVRYSDIAKAIADRLETVSRLTLNGHLTVLRQVFDMAVTDEIIAKSPAARVKNLRVQRTPPDPFTAEERDRILGRIHERYHEQVWTYFVFAFYTGLRPSEQIALKWGDVDWTRRQVTVRRAKVKGEEKSTKTSRERRVDLSDVAIDALTRQKAHTFMLDRGEGVIFRNPNTGKAWASEFTQRESYFTPTLTALGIRHRRAYQTRHTFATLLLMGGVNPAYISRQLGHASLAMLFEVYGTWLEAADGGLQAKRANEVMGGKLSDAKVS